MRDIEEFLKNIVSEKSWDILIPKLYFCSVISGIGVDSCVMDTAGYYLSKQLQRGQKDEKSIVQNKQTL